jgi:phage FluMu protein Com
VEQGDAGALNNRRVSMKDNFNEMEEFRCPTCNKLFFKYRLKGSLIVQVKCTRCANVTNLIVNKNN